MKDPACTPTSDFDLSKDQTPGMVCSVFKLLYLRSTLTKMSFH